MPVNFCFPENCKVVNGYAPRVGAAAAVTGAYISLKNIQRAWVVFHYFQADANAITFNVLKATDVAASGSIATDVLMPIWSNLACAVSDLLVRRTDAISYAAGTGAASKMIIMEVDPDALGQLAGVQYDCIAGYSTAIAAAQYLGITYVLQPRYQSRVLTQPTVVTD
jgi:hypothetical protein